MKCYGVIAHTVNTLQNEKISLIKMKIWHTNLLHDLQNVKKVRNDQELVPSEPKRHALETKMGNIYNHKQT